MGGSCLFVGIGSVLVDQCGLRRIAAAEKRKMIPVWDMLKNTLNKLERQAAQIISSRQQFPLVSLATVLHGGSLLYGTGAGIRIKLFEKGLLSSETIPRPVISIGNLTAGGTGKTPLTVHLAAMLMSHGFKVLVVSRGYKRLDEKAVEVVSDGVTVKLDARRAGDEPYLIARLVPQAPVMVGKNRAETARAGLKQFDPDVILLDDAFQHQALARDLNLLLLDAAEPFGNGYLLPRGPLREPIAALHRADAIVFTRSQGAPTETQHEMSRMIQPKPVFHCRHTPVVRRVLPAMALLDKNESLHGAVLPGDILKDRPVFIFSALARNDTFRAALSEMGARIVGSMEFGAHHSYAPKDIEDLVQAGQRSGCNALVTTDKDWVRLPRIALPLELIVIGVDIEFGDAHKRWRRFVLDKVSEARQVHDRKKLRTQVC
jgi:tetraacyldisaccharide 4'-kinase